MRGAIFLSLSGVLTLSAFLYGQMRPVVSMRSLLEHEISYMDAWGKAILGDSGVECHHDRLMNGLTIPDKNFSSKHYGGEYLMFYPDLPARYQIKLRNPDSSSYSYLRITAFPRFLEPSQKWKNSGVNRDSREWKIGVLKPRESVVVAGEVHIPEEALSSGLFQIYFQVTGRRKGSKGDELLAEDFKPALWCSAPPAGQ